MAALPVSVCSDMICPWSAHTNGQEGVFHQRTVKGLSRIPHGLVPPPLIRFYQSAWDLDARLMLGVIAKLFYYVAYAYLGHWGLQ